MCSQRMLHPATALLKACGWLLFAFRTQPTCRKSLRALTLAWPFSFPLCHSPASGSHFLRHTAACFRCPLCPGQRCPSIACCNYLCSFGAAQTNSKERPPTLSPPSSSLDPCPPVFSLRFQSLIIVSALLL